MEGAFGVLKNGYEFQRFLLRGKRKVKLEILLLCIGYNLNKLQEKIQEIALTIEQFLDFLIVMSESAAQSSI